MNPKRQKNRPNPLLALALAATLLVGLALSPIGFTAGAASPETPAEPSAFEEPAETPGENTETGNPGEEGDGSEGGDSNPGGIPGEPLDPQTPAPEPEPEPEPEPGPEPGPGEEQPGEEDNKDEDGGEERPLQDVSLTADFIPTGNRFTVASAQDIINAVDAAAGDEPLTLVVAPGTAFEQCVVLSRSVTLYIISESGPITIPSLHNAHAGRHFRVNSGAEVELYFEDVTLGGTSAGISGGFSVQPGASLYLEGAHTRFTSNSEENGGAIYAGGSVTIAASLFERASSVRGGIIYVAPTGALRIEGEADAPVTLRTGNASLAGGAIYVAGGGSMAANHLVITSGVENALGTSAEVGGRTTNGQGGGIWWEITPGSGEQALTNSVIEDSMASSHGAAAYISIAAGGHLHAFDNNLIQNNSSTTGSGAVALISDGTVGSFNGNTLTRNFMGMGMGLYLSGTGSLTIENTNITNNPGSNSSELRVNYKRINNAAGGIYTNLRELHIIGGEISGNAAENTYMGQGGGILAAGGTTTMAGAVVQGNTAVTTGGGVHVASGATFVLQSGEIMGNTAQGSVGGGGVHVASGGVFRMTGGEVAANTAAYGGGVYLAAGAEAALNGGEITANKTSAGGGLGVFSYGTLHLGGVIIQNHVADGKNGAGVMVGSGSTATMSTGGIINNTLTNTANASAVGHGAGIYVNANASLTITGGLLEYNEALRGGAIYARENNSITIAAGMLRGNAATLRGGAVYLEDDNTLEIAAEHSTTLMGNSAPGGGAIYSYGENTVTLGGEQLMISHSEATAANLGGGVVYMERGTLHLNGGRLSGNTAQGDGGAIYLLSSEVTATVTGGSIISNIAGGSGGAIFNSAGSLTITGGALEYNIAKGNGGAIASTFGTNRFGDTGGGPKFTGNTAGASGGGVYISNGALVMQNTTLSGNNAGQDGGGLYVAVGGLALRAPQAGGEVIGTLEANLFQRNTAGDNGGGAYIYIHENGESDSISGNQFRSNNAGQDGGGLYVAYYGLGNRVMDNIADDNTAGGNGGGLYVTGTMAKYFAITNDEITNNKANSGLGGGVYVAGTILRLYNPEKYGLTVSGTPKISGNTAQYGGGIYAAGTAKIIIEHGEINGNRAEFNGGGIYSNTSLEGDDALSAGNTDLYAGDLVRVENASISTNTAGGSGGGVYIGQRGGLSLHGASLRGNTAGLNGGGVYVATFGELEIGELKDETAPEGSGEATVFANNAATAGSGGGLYLGNGILSMQYAEFRENRAPLGNGGGLLLILHDDGASAPAVAQALTHSSFLGNEAVNGGGMHITIKEGAVSKVIAENTISGNIASGDGGGVWVSYSGEGKSVYGNTISYNAAARGGGMFVTGTPQDGNRMSITSDKITTNTAQAGGGVFVDNSFFVLFDAAAMNAENPGSYHKIDGTPITQTAEILGNSAQNGGGIYLHNSVLYYQNGLVSGNRAHANGGGILADSGSRLDVYNPYSLQNIVYKLRVIANTAEGGNGGGLYLTPSNGNPTTLDGFTIQANTALNGDGGGVYVQKAQLAYLNVKNSLFGAPTIGTADGENHNAASAYVDELNPVTDGDYIALHHANLTNITGQSPSGYMGGAWARLEAGLPGVPLYYNNADIGFHRAATSEITVTYHANGGVFAGEGGVTQYSQDIEEAQWAYAPEPTQEGTTFIGWYSAPYTAEEIRKNGFTQASELTEDSGRLGFYCGASGLPDQNFYAAWLPAPEVEIVYDTATTVTVTAQPYAMLRFMAANSEIAHADALGVYTFNVSGLTAGMQVTVTQTAFLLSGNFESPAAQSSVLPTHALIYSINANREMPAEQDRLNTDWKPADITGLETDADTGAQVTVAAPAPGIEGRKGYQFTGWQTAAGRRYGEGDPLTVYDEDVVLFAQWAPLYTLSYNDNTGEGALAHALPPSKEEVSGSSLHIGEWNLLPDALDGLREGYRFEYWTEDAANNGATHYLDAATAAQREDPAAYTTELTLNRGITLYAKWLQLYRVTYMPGYEGAQGWNFTDDGWYAMGEDTFTVTTAEPSREGYTFLGWHFYQNPTQDDDLWYPPADAAGTLIEYDMDEPGITLYAIWRQNLSVTYNGNGSTSGTAPEGVTNFPYNNVYTFAGQGALRKEGYKFLGWSTDEEATAPEYTANQILPLTGNLYLFAVWQAVPVDESPGLTKEASAANVAPGETFTYTITVTNPNAYESVTATVADSLPSYLTLNSASEPPATPAPDLTWEKRLAPGEEWAITLNVTLAASYNLGGAVVNTASAALNGNAALSRTATATTPTPQPQPVEPVVRKTASEAVVAPGQTFSYTITVENNSYAKVDAVVTDILPGALRFLDSDTAYSSGAPQEVTWAKAMEPREVWDITLTVALASDYTDTDNDIFNTATAVFNAQATLTGSGTAQTPVKLNVSAPRITKQANQSAVKPGDTFSYTLLVANENIVEMQATVLDSLPDGLTLVNASPAPDEENENALAWHKTLAPGEEWEITVTVKLRASYTGTSITNRAVASLNLPGETEFFTAEASAATAVTQPAPPPSPQPPPPGPQPPANGSAAPTGDSARLPLWAGIAIAALAALCMLAIVLKRRRRNK